MNCQVGMNDDVGFGSSFESHFSSILLGLLVSLGLASALSLPYTPMHAILPFLCLGIGIDDMFVIMQCLNNIK